jgi:O-antigen ligase
VPRLLGLLSLVLIGALAGFTAMTRPQLVPFLLGAGVLAIAVAIRPVVVAVVSVPGALALQRIGGDLVSASELMTAVAAVLGVPVLMRTRTPRALTIGLTAGAAYLLIFACVVLLHPTAAGAGEWVHRAVIVLGGMVVGAWLVIERKFGVAFALLAVGMAGVGVLAVVDSASRGWEPAYPLFFHKNFIGSVAATTLLVLLIARERIPLPRWAFVATASAIVAGLLASQSRGGMIAFGAGMVAWLAVTALPGRGRSAKTAILVAAGIVLFALQSVLNDFDPRNRGQFSSSELRTLVNTETIALWQQRPLAGWGIDYWRLPELRTYILDNGPTNVFLQSLAEGGLLSLGALVVLLAGVGFALSQARGPLMAVGVAVLVARFAHASVDQYWAAAPTAVTWVVVGAALMDRRQEKPEEPVAHDEAAVRPSRT